MQEKEENLKKKYVYKCEHGRQKSRCKECGGSGICEHNRIRITCKDCGGSSICEHNRMRNTCKNCGGSCICEHNRIRSSCKECDGGSICEHDRIRSKCKECDGGSICEHDRIRSQCKECGGCSICEHDRIRSQCKECVGGSICEHNKVRTRCQECEGGSLCEHNRQNGFCKECGGSGICEHNRIRSHCKECHGGSICEHNRIRSVCKICGGGSICEHDRIRSQCKECEGSAICTHERQKSQCKECGGSSLCKSCKDVIGNPKYDKYCLRCFIYLFPDKPVCRNYKTKEIAVRDYVLEKFPNVTWTTDKKIIDGCSRRRPDLLLDLDYQVIIIEIDEYKHNSYDCSCENKRIMEISQDLDHRPVIFIRFNPDGYINMDEEKIESCWGTLKTGIDTVKKEKKEEWENRLKCLKNQIKYWINPKNKTNKMIETIQLYYDDFDDDE